MEEDDECRVECGRRGDCERIGGWDDTSVADERSDSTGDHEGPVTSVAGNKDGSQIASKSKDCGVRVWRARDGGLARALEGHGPGVTSVAWSKGGSQIASGSEDCSVRVWRASDGACGMARGSVCCGLLAGTLLSERVLFYSGVDDWRSVVLVRCFDYRQPTGPTGLPDNRDRARRASHHPHTEGNERRHEG